MSKYINKLRRIRAENGLCVHCGKAKPVEGKTECKACKDYKANYNRERTAKRVASGLCIKCGEPNDNTTRLCKNCTDYNKQSARLSRIRLGKFRGWIEFWEAYPPKDLTQIIVCDTDGAVYALERYHKETWLEVIDDEVIAWRYFPKPFKGGED